MKAARARFVSAEIGDRRSAPTLTSKVYEQLRNEIIGCQLKPNEKLLLAALRQRLGVGMSAVREALSRLAAEGLVWAEDQRGFRVSPVSKEDLIDLTRVRVQIEQLALRESIRRGDVAWEANVLAAYHQMSRSAPPSRGFFDINDPSSQLHRGFHDALVAGSGSHWLQHFREVVYTESERYRRLAILPAVRERRDIQGEHKALLDAALRRDAGAACQAIEQHFSTTAELAIEAQARSIEPAVKKRQNQPRGPRRIAART